ncbi:MAG TPA: twin-arginine translocase subunit TatC [Candidatus Saccharimonadales bacterium]|nr:twin-arginine translocase subunit TatC [Candidatus Saccharimonadales bacterium]
MKKRAKKPAKQKLAKASLAPREKLPLIEHLKELRRRLFYVAACVAVGAAVAYGLEQRLIDVLLRPSHGQKFIYTSPLGGMNFLFSVCLDIGLVLATPIIIYQILAFIQPLMRDTTRKFLVGASAATGIVAVGGVLFGYFIGLPQALHFLLHQFTTVQVRPLITIQSYMQFVSMYLFGSALMFQLPLILLFINRIKPLKPSSLFKYERHMIAASFIIAFIMNPTPNVVDQLLVVLPILVTYQIGIALVWTINKNGHTADWLQRLREEDTARQAERQARALAPLTEGLPPLPDFIAEDLEPISAPVYDGQPVAPSAVPSSRPYQSTLATPTRRNYAPLRSGVIQ